MKKYFFFYILLLLPIIGIAQTYKYIGVEDGLSNRRVYAIQKGPKGYMWFLTHDGIDRYNGKDFKPYKLMDGDEEVNSMMNLNWLYVDPKGTIWEIGKKGRVFRYDTKHDRFVLVYKLPESEVKGYAENAVVDAADNTPVLEGGNTLSGSQEWKQTQE